MELFEFTFKSFWHFIGMTILFTGVANFLFLMWNRFWRHMNIRKHGYPPEHCDADGDFKPALKKDKKKDKDL